MSGRDPTKLRNQKGNHYCMNCQQPIFTKTPFSTIGYTLSLLFGFAFGILTAIQSGSLGLASMLAFVSLIGYPAYWFFTKKPVCPICNARHIEKITSKQQQPNAQQNQQRDTSDFDSDSEKASLIQEYKNIVTTDRNINKISNFDHPPSEGDVVRKFTIETTPAICAGLIEAALVRDENIRKFKRLNTTAEDSIQKKVEIATSVAEVKSAFATSEFETEWVADRNFKDGYVYISTEEKEENKVVVTVEKINLSERTSPGFVSIFDSILEQHNIPKEITIQDTQSIKANYDLEDTNKVVRIAMELDDSVQTYRDSEIDENTWVASLETVRLGEKVTGPLAVTLEEGVDQTEIIFDYKEALSKGDSTLPGQVRDLLKEYDSVGEMESHLAEIKGGYIKQAK